MKERTFLSENWPCSNRCTSTDTKTKSATPCHDITLHLEMEGLTSLEATPTFALNLYRYIMIHHPVALFSICFKETKQSHGCSINGAASRIGLAKARPPEPGAVAPGPKPFPPSWNRVSMPHGAISSALPIRFRTAYDQSQGCSLWFFGSDSTSICTSQCRSKAWSNKSANPNCGDSGNSTSLCQ